MKIAIIANDKKKELITEFCIAYCGILSKHNICSTAITGKYISEATGLNIEKMLSGSHGGLEQMPKPLQQAAEVRINNPFSNLAELGELLDPPIGKSGVNNRLRRLAAFAQQLREENGDA